MPEVLRGCPPLRYPVSAPFYDTREEKLGSGFTLRGIAPVRAGNSCAVVGSTAKGPNTALLFQPAGFYSETQDTSAL